MGVESRSAWISSEGFPGGRRHRSGSSSWGGKCLCQSGYYETTGRGYFAEVRRRGDDSYDLLSVREKEILHVLASGKTNREIADLLYISISTVETHRNNIFQKLNLHNLAGLILYALRKGLISGNTLPALLSTDL
jgi:DNA-binding CsgD family transcriptional regulator